MFNWLFEKKTNRAFKKNKRERGFRSFDSMETILILFDYKDRDDINTIAKDLRDCGKRVLLWTLKTDEPKTPSTIIGLRAIKEEDLSNWYILTKEIKEEFRSLKYDTLFNFASVDKAPKDVLQYLLANNTAEFCIGIQQPEVFRVFDFILLQGEEQNLVDTYEQIKLYTGKNIRTPKEDDL